MNLSLVIFPEEDRFLKQELTWKRTTDKVTAQAVEMGGNAVFGELSSLRISKVDPKIIEKQSESMFHGFKWISLLKIKLFSRDKNGKNITSQIQSSRNKFDLQGQSVFEAVHDILVEKNTRMTSIFVVHFIIISS